MNRRREQGMSLVELLVVLMALMVVSAMGFDILYNNGERVARGLSLTTRGDRLRHLQNTLDQDLASVYGGATNETVRITALPSNASRGELLRTEILSQGDSEVTISELIYSFEESPSGSESWTVTRTIDPDLSEERSDEASSRPLFRLTRSERLIWEATGEVVNGEAVRWLRVGLDDSRNSEYKSERRILLVGS